MKHALNQRGRLCFAAVIALYAVLFVCLCASPLYAVEQAHNDRLFSADDVYFVQNFFSVDMDHSPRIIKHPLLIVFGSLFTRLERAVFGEISIQHHYECIVILQLAVSLVSLWFLYRALRELHEQDETTALLLCGVYALSFSVIFYTFIAESYIFSACALIMTYYFAGKQNPIALVLLGAVSAGITITNAVIWALIVLFSEGKLKRKAVILLSGGALFCALTAISPVRTVFFQNIISGGMGSARNYSDHFTGLYLLRMVLFVIFGSTFFCVDQREASPFGEYEGDALSFLPSANALTTVLILCWTALVCAAVIYLIVKKDCRALPLLAVMAWNLLLHGVIQYGLKEGFLYSLHHLFAQLGLVSLLMVDMAKYKKLLQGFLAVFLLCEIALNAVGYSGILHRIFGFVSVQ